MRILSLVLMLLAGCAPINHPRMNVEKPPTPVVNDVRTYVYAIQFAIQSEFYDADDYIGKTCNLKIDLDDKGQLSGLHVLTGDLPLCTAAMKAARQANLPAPPDAEEHEKIRHATLVFAPE